LLSNSSQGSATVLLGIACLLPRRRLNGLVLILKGNESEDDNPIFFLRKNADQGAKQGKIVRGYYKRHVKYGCR